MRRSFQNLLIEMICGIFIFLFLYSAIHKWLQPEPFKITLYQSPVLSQFAPLLQFTIPLAEIGIVILLCFKRSRLWGLYGCFALMSLFVVYIVYMLFATPHLPCSCGGIIEQLTWKQHLLLNILLTSLSLFGIWTLKKINAVRQTELVLST